MEGKIIEPEVERVMCGTTKSIKPAAYPDRGLVMTGTGGTLKIPAPGR
jgi:hypothetical protein